jgi:hypothetical protein
MTGHTHARQAEREKIEENERSLKKMQKQLREEEVEMLRGKGQAKQVAFPPPTTPTTTAPETAAAFFLQYIDDSANDSRPRSPVETTSRKDAKESRPQGPSDAAARR